MSTKKKDNLAGHRDQLVEKNTELVKRIIEHIEKLGGGISYSTVSQVSYDLAKAENGEKGLTGAAISKNKVYRALVDEASARNVNLSDESKANYQQYSMADLQMSLHALRVKNAELENENKILRRTLSQAKIPDTNPDVRTAADDEIETSIKDLKIIATSIVDRLLELELVYFTKAHDLELAMLRETLIKANALYKFYPTGKLNARTN